MGQRTKYFNMLDIDANFDIEYDTAPDYVSVSEREKLKKAAAEQANKA